MSDFSYYLTNLAVQLSSSVPNAGTDWTKVKGLISNLIPILWIATAIVSTVWLVIKFISANFQSATGDQAKYEQAKKARKRAIFAWVTGLLWPLVFFIAWPIAKMIYVKLPGVDPNDFPDLF